MHVDSPRFQGRTAAWGTFPCTIINLASLHTSNVLCRWCDASMLPFTLRDHAIVTLELKSLFGAKSRDARPNVIAKVSRMPDRSFEPEFKACTIWLQGFEYRSLDSQSGSSVPYCLLYAGSSCVEVNLCGVPPTLCKPLSRPSYGENTFHQTVINKSPHTR